MSGGAKTLDGWIADVYREWSMRNEREMYLFAGKRHRETDAMRFAVMCLTSPNFRDVLDRVNEHAAERAAAERPQTPTRADSPGHRPQDTSSVSRADGRAPGLATTGAPEPVSSGCFEQGGAQ